MLASTARQLRHLLDRACVTHTRDAGHHSETAPIIVIDDAILVRGTDRRASLQPVWRGVMPISHRTGTAQWDDAPTEAR